MTSPTRRIAVSLTLAALAVAPAAADVVNDIVLRVNNRIATRADFESQLAERRQMLLSADLGGDRDRLLAGAGRAVIKELYEELLLLSRADQLGVAVSEQDVDRAVAQARERMGITSEEQFRQALAASGITETDLRQRMRRNILVQQVMGQEVQARVEVPEEELRAIYRERQDEFTVPEALRLREIIVLADEAGDLEAAGARAREIVDRLRGGATLEEVAAEGGEAGTTTGVVDLGWVERGDLDAELSAAAWSLEPGQISDPVSGRGGFHVLSLEERREAGIRPFDEVQAEIAARERERRVEEEYPAYLRELETSSYVVIDAPPEAAGFSGVGEGADVSVPDTGLAAPSPAEAPAPVEPPSGR